MIKTFIILGLNTWILSAAAQTTSVDTFYEKATSEAQASFFDVMPARGGMLSNVVIDSQVKTAKVGSYTSLKLHVSCYATNLRSIANPVAGNSLVWAMVDVKDSSNAVKTLIIKFPAQYLKPKSVADSELTAEAHKIELVTVSGLTNAKINASGNTIQLLLPSLKEMTITSSGEVVNINEKNLIVSGIKFAQGPVPNTHTAFYGSYFGSQGPLSGSVKWYTSKDGKNIDVYAAFPGAASPGQRAVYQGETRTGFCGGYYSPLMLFFTDDMPAFTGKSKFSLSKAQDGQIFWPEAQSPGYFLVVDKNNDSLIQDGDEMFGDSDKFADGFQNLASYDANQDGVINHKDPIFKKLKLWNDQNGDGVSQKDELRTLPALSISELNLKYVNETANFGERAQYKQKSNFKFKRDGKNQSGILVDMWFSPAP